MQNIVKETEISKWKKGVRDRHSKKEDPYSVLSGKDFESMDFRENFEFFDAQFDLSDLSNCKLDNINFSNCSFRGANLSNASVKGCNFSHANFSEANLEGVEFIETNMQGVIGDGNYIKSLHINEDFSIAYSFDTFWIACETLTYSQCASMKLSEYTSGDISEAHSFYEKYSASEPRFLIEIATQVNPASNTYAEDN